jgi:acetyltransferase-like isoleucine patch superfamily enzyme
MAFLSDEQLAAFGFAKLGVDVKVSDKATIYNPELISIDDHSRIDDFCVVSGRVTLGRNVHIAVFCNLAGGTEGIHMDDFSGLAYGCHVFSQSDDYSGKTMTNPTVPSEFKDETRQAIYIGRHCIIGTHSLVFPGVSIGEGTAVAAKSVVTRSTDDWSMYSGSPARKFQARSKDLLALEQQYLNR